MKFNWMALACLLLCQGAVAGTLDSWVGTFVGQTTEGEKCQLSLYSSSLSIPGEYDLSFSTIELNGTKVSADPYSLESIRSVLEPQLAAGDNPVSIHHPRKIWGEFNVDVAISVDSQSMLPTSIHGRVFMSDDYSLKVDCNGLKKF